VLARPRDAESVILAPLQPAGLFEGFVPGARLPLRYELKVSYPDGNVFTSRDPYAFTPTPGNLALHLAGEQAGTILRSPGQPRVDERLERPGSAATVAQVRLCPGVTT
jgi:hypothetical protein